MTTGMNGQQLKEYYFNAFESWKQTLSDDDFRQIIYRGQLSRKDMAKAIGCQTAVFRQNPLVKESLKNLEDDLRERGILPPLSPSTDKISDKLNKHKVKRNDVDAKHLSELEAENIELKARVSALENQLQRYTELSEAMSEMGFMPR
ncbi:MAG: VPA1267 family protein [Psychrobium sp.]